MARGKVVLWLATRAWAGAALRELRTAPVPDPTEDEWWTAPWDYVAPDQLEYVGASSLLETGGADGPSSLLAKASTDAQAQSYLALDGQWSSRRRNPRRRRTFIPPSIEQAYGEFQSSLATASKTLEDAGIAFTSREERMYAMQQVLSDKMLAFLEKLTDKMFDLTTKTGEYQESVGEADSMEEANDALAKAFCEYNRAAIDPSLGCDMGAGSGELQAGDNMPTMYQKQHDEVNTQMTYSLQEMGNVHTQMDSDLEMEAHHAALAVQEEENDEGMAETEEETATSEALESASLEKQKLGGAIEIDRLLVGKDQKALSTKLGMTEKNVEKESEGAAKDIEKVLSNADSTWDKEHKNLDKATDKMAQFNEKTIATFEKDATDALEDFDQNAADGFEDFQKNAEKDVGNLEKSKDKQEQTMDKNFEEAVGDVEGMKEQYELVRDHDATIREYVEDSGNSMRYSTEQNSDQLKESVKQQRDAFVENLGSAIGHLETNMDDSTEEMKGQILENLNDLGQDAQARPEEVSELKRGFVDQMNSDVADAVQEEADVDSNRKEGKSTLKNFQTTLSGLEKTYSDAYRDLNADTVKFTGKSKDLYAKADSKMKSGLQRTQNFIRAKAEEMAGMPGEISTEFTKLKDSLQTANDNMQTAVSTIGMQLGSAASELTRRAEQLESQTDADAGQIDVMGPNMIEPMKRDFLKMTMTAERDKHSVNSTWSKSQSKMELAHKNLHKGFAKLVDKTAEGIEDSVAPKVQDAMVDDSRRLTNLRDVVNDFDTQQGATAEEVMAHLKKLEKEAAPLHDAVPHMEALLAAQQEAVNEAQKVFGEDQISAAKTNFDADLKTAAAQATGQLQTDVSHTKEQQEEAVRSGMLQLDNEITATEEKMNQALAGTQAKMQLLQKSAQERAAQVTEEVGSYQGQVTGLETNIKEVETETERQAAKIEEDARHGISQGAEGMMQVETDTKDKLGAIQKDVISMLHEADGTYYNSNTAWGEQFNGEVTEEDKALEEKLRLARESLQAMEDKLKNANMQAQQEGKTAQSLIDGAGERFKGAEGEAEQAMEEERLKMKGTLDQKIASAQSSEGVAGERLEGTTNVLGSEAGDLSRSAGDAVTLEGADAEKTIKGESASLDLFLQSLSEEEREAFLAQKEKAKMMGEAFGSFEHNIHMIQLAALREDNMTTAQKNAIIELINSERQQLGDNWVGLEKSCMDSQERLVEGLNQQCATMGHQMATISQDYDLVIHEQDKIADGYEKMTGSEAYQTLLKIQQVDEFSSQVMNDGYNLEQWMKSFTEDAKPWRARVEKVFGESEEASRLFAMEQEITDAENKARLARMAASAENQLGSMVAEIGSGSGLKEAEKGFAQAMGAFNDKQRAVAAIEDERINGISGQLADVLGEFGGAYSSAKGALSALLKMDGGQGQKMHTIMEILQNIMSFNEEQAEHARKVLSIRQQDVQDKLLLGGLGPDKEPDHVKVPEKGDLRSMLEDTQILEKKFAALQDRHTRIGPRIDALAAKLVEAIKAVQAPAAPATVEATPATNDGH